MTSMLCFLDELHPYCSFVSTRQLRSGVGDLSPRQVTEAEPRLLFDTWHL
jgi:hypothetical protein